MEQRENALASTSRLLLPAILLIAFGLRVWLLGQRSVWYDEAFSVFLAETGIPDIIRGTAADIQPPLYYILLHYWQLIGEQVYTLRFLSVIFSLLSVALVYRFSERVLGRRAAFFAALFAAISPFQIQYAQELRMYSLLEFLLLMNLYVLARLEGSAVDLRWVPLLALSGAMALYTHNLALVSTAVPAIYAASRRDGRLLRAVGMGLGLSLVLYSPWVAILASQLQSVQRSYWIAPPGVAELFQFLLSSTTYLPLPDWLLPLALFTTLAAILLLLKELGLGKKTENPSGIALLLMLWTIPPLLMVVMSLIIRSVFVIRGVIVSSLAFSVLIALWVSQQGSTAVRIVASAILVALMLPALYFQLSYSQFPRSPYADAATYLHGRVAPGDAIVHDNKMTYFPMHFYERDLAQTWIADPPEAGSNTLAPVTMSVLGTQSTLPAQATSGKSRVWFVIYERALSEAAGRGQEQGNLAYMQANFTQVGLERFNDLNVYVYQK